MKKYIISYRGKAVRTIECYTDGEAKSKASYWYMRVCRDTDKDKKQLKVITPSGMTLRVF